MHKCWISTKTAAVSGGALIMWVNSFNKAALLTVLLERTHLLKHWKRLRAMLNKQRQKVSKWMKAKRSWMLVVLWLNSPNRGITLSSDHEPSELFGFICFLYSTQETNDAALVFNCFYLCGCNSDAPNKYCPVRKPYVERTRNKPLIFLVCIFHLYIISLLFYCSQYRYPEQIISIKKINNTLYLYTQLHANHGDRHTLKYLCCTRSFNHQHASKN